jgi:BolA protein
MGCLSLLPYHTGPEGVFGGGTPNIPHNIPAERELGLPKDRGAVERREHIEAVLRRELDADPVQVVDESHLHAGHAGARGGGGHFRAVIVSARFEGRSAVERQRLVYAALGSEMGREIHALSMQTLTPAQWREQAPARDR